MKPKGKAMKNIQALAMARCRLEEIVELATHPGSDRIHELASRTLAQIQEILK